MILHFFKAEFKYYFRSKFALVGYVIGILLNLTVYYFTAKAFVPKDNLNNLFLNRGYFEYIVFGELLLILAQVSLGQGQESFFRYKESGILEQLFFSKTKILRSAIYIYVSLCMIQFLFVFFTLIFSWSFFSVEFDALFFIRLCTAILFCGVLFSGLYFLNLTISAFIGRRNGSLGHFVNLMTIFSGAYFPLEVFSSEILRKALSLSPFALFVSWSRSFVYLGSFDWTKFSILLFVWWFLPFILSCFIFKWYLSRKNYVTP